MAIVKGEIIKAEDVKQKLLDNVNAIKNKIQTIVSIGEHLNSSFLEPDFPETSKIATIVPSSKRSNFLSNFNNLLDQVKQLSCVFDVEPLHILYLSGFADYALCCHTLASYIRHTEYVVSETQFKELYDYNNASYIQEIPTMSALIPGGMLFDPIENKGYFNDFRANWAENYQQDLSSVNLFLNSKDKSDGTLWINKTYTDGTFSNNINPTNFKDTSKPQHVGSLCTASHALQMLDILSSINCDFGETISCLYFWNKNRSWPLPTVKVTYKNLSKYTNLITNAKTNVFEMRQYSIHTTKYLNELLNSDNGTGWTISNSNIKMINWIVEGTNTKWQCGSNHIIDHDIVLVPDLDGSLVVDFTITNYDRTNGGAGNKTYKDYMIKNRSSHSISQSGGVITIGGLKGFSHATINHLECGMNEIAHSHLFSIKLYDCVGSESWLLLRYNPAYQKEAIVPKYKKIVFSSFNNAFNLKINNNGEVKFKIVGTYGDAEDGGREFFLEHLSNGGVTIDGGIGGITARM